MSDTFQDMLGGYHLTPQQPRQRLFAELIAGELKMRSTPTRVLDIGCGTGLGTGGDRVECLALIRQAATELWGVEPDPAINPEHGLLDHLIHALLEDADLPEHYFDVAYAFLVMEHVQQPDRFLHALYRCLKPGGVFVFLTLNSRHYFTRIAKLSKQIRVDEWLLRQLRPAEIDDYHYPVAYRFNNPRAIERMGQANGFPCSEFVFQETNSPQPYFPGPLRPVMHVLDGVRAKKPESLLNLIGRMVREPGS